MDTSQSSNNAWLTIWMQEQSIPLWGIADLRGLDAPADPVAKKFPSAVSWAYPMNPKIMAGIQQGPNQAYADEYSDVNNRINSLAALLSDAIRDRGFYTLPLAASRRTDPVAIKGDFPHKTAATRAGIGWIGRHCQLITRKFGPWIRLGTVFTTMDLAYSSPIERHFCGTCTCCVDACPSKALQGDSWSPGVPRHRILDVNACDRWKKEHYYQYHKGHNCGICTAVCPYGLKVLKKNINLP